jgi:Tol biopolymer transport system component
MLLGRYPFQNASFSGANSRIAYKYQENNKDVLVVRDLNTNTNLLTLKNMFSTFIALPGNFSSDGRFFAYLVNANGSSSAFLVQVYDFLKCSNILASVKAGSTTASQGFASPRVPPMISKDGRWVYFYSNSRNLDPIIASPQGSYLFARNIVSQQTLLIGGGFDPNSPPSCSADGNMVAYQEKQPLPPYAYQIFVYDLTQNTTNLVSIAMSGRDYGNGSSRCPSISADGRYVAFASDASNIVPNDINNSGDVFVRDLVAGTTTVLSPSVDGLTSANRLSNHPILSADGRTVAFQSFATDITREHRQFNNNVYVVQFRDEPSDNLVLSMLQTGATSQWPPALTWKASMGTGYQLEYNDDLRTANWIKLPAQITALGATALVPDSSTNMPPRRFYRLRALPLW